MIQGLVDYGIFTEESDIRAHVGVAMRKVYVFRTDAAREALRRKDYAVKQAFQSRVFDATADGWLVPPADIEDLRSLPLPDDRWWAGFNEGDGTSAKGAAAVALVVRLLGKGHFPLWLAASESGDIAVQVAGTDIVVCAKQRIQVKCDWHAGNPQKSGCLYLQKSERNPLRRY